MLDPGQPLEYETGLLQAGNIEEKMLKIHEFKY